MTREEAKSCIGTIEMLQRLAYNIHGVMDVVDADNCKNIIKALEKEPCEDCISRQAVLVEINKIGVKGFETYNDYSQLFEFVDTLPPVTPKEKIGYCKDCKWWKDNDGVYRRGIGAESKCPINSKKVYEGNGYCYLFEPQESENKE